MFQSHPVGAEGCFLLGVFKAPTQPLPSACVLTALGHHELCWHCLFWDFWTNKQVIFGLTDTLVCALVVARAALVPPAVLRPHRLPVGRFIADPERFTPSVTFGVIVHLRRQEVVNRKWAVRMVPPVVRASVGGPGVRARLLGHVIVRMGVGLFDWGGVAERTKCINQPGEKIRSRHLLKPRNQMEEAKTKYLGFGKHVSWWRPKSLTGWNVILTLVI